MMEDWNICHTYISKINKQGCGLVRKGHGYVVYKEVLRYFIETGRYHFVKMDTDIIIKKFSPILGQLPIFY